MTQEDIALQKGLPASLDCERFILGSICLNGDAFERVAAQLSPEDFSIEKHRRIFWRMIDLRDRGEKIDRVTLANELMKQGQLESVDGLGYLASLDEGLPEIANLEGYIRIVKDKATLRKLIFASQKVIDRCLQGTDEPDEILSSAQGQLVAMGRQAATEGPESIATYVEQRGPQRILDPSERDPGLPLGFASIDRMIGGGLREGQILVLGARPSAGKTALAANILENVARTGKMPCFFSMEMPKSAVINRMLVKLSGVGLNRFLAGGLDGPDRARIQEALAELYSLPIYIDDTAGLKASDIASRVNAMEEKPALVVIDYFQLVRSSIRGNGDERFTQVATDLQLLSKDTGIPMIILSQMSRDSSRRVNGKKDYRPQLEDFRGSGTIEQIANVGAFLFREEFYDPTQAALRGKVEFIIRKNRDGETGTAILRLVGWRFSFSDADTEAEGAPPYYREPDENNA